MRLSISTRILLALVVVSFMVLAFSAAATRWNFQRGFLDYVSEQELAAATETADSLATIYQGEDGWEGIRGNEHRWRRLLRDSSPKPPRGDRTPPLGTAIDRPPDRPRGGPPGGDPFELGRRVSLVDAAGSMLVGSASTADTIRSVPVVVSDLTVGYVQIAARHELTDQLDREFAREQSRSIYLVATATLLLACLASAFLAHQITRPIATLTQGARLISGGDYRTRITELRNDEFGDLAREFNELAVTLDRNRQSRRRWVSDIAHELRTPLSVLRGEVDAIEDGVRQFDSRTQRSLQAEIARLSALVSELHELSVYDEGGQAYDREIVDLSALLRSVSVSAESRLLDAGIALTTELPGDPLLVFADAVKLERVFLNLIENTIRYTNPPGSLIISCKARDNRAVIEFADTAPSAPEAALGKLFDRLFRVDDSRSRDTGGSGLGLAICKAIVSAHDGTIEASVSDAGGILIRISLPVHVPAAEAR